MDTEFSTKSALVDLVADLATETLQALELLFAKETSDVASVQAAVPGIDADDLHEALVGLQELDLGYLDARTQGTVFRWRAKECRDLVKSTLQAAGDTFDVLTAVSASNLMRLRSLALFGSRPERLVVDMLLYEAGNGLFARDIDDALGIDRRNTVSVFRFLESLGLGKGVVDPLRPPDRRYFFRWSHPETAASLREWLYDEDAEQNLLEMRGLDPSSAEHAGLRVEVNGKPAILWVEGGPAAAPGFDKLAHAALHCARRAA